MSQIQNLPIDYNNKFIVVDEDISAPYAEYLIICWLQRIRKKGIMHPINILLFSKPQYALEKQLKSAQLTNYCIKDYFNIDLQNKETNIYEKLINDILHNLNSIFVIDCLSTLALQIGIAKACKFVEKASQTLKMNVFCINRDIHWNTPKLETLGNIYVKIKQSKRLSSHFKIQYKVFSIIRKAGGSVVHSNALVEQSIDDFSIESEKTPDNVCLIKSNNPPESVLKPQTTFKIELSESEIKQRDSVPLPYTLSAKPGGGSKIIYVPDDADDLDEEDPDDDLDI